MEFQILGPFEITSADGEVEIRGAKPRAVLGLLLVHANEPVPAEQLIDDLWDGNPPASALTTLQTYISQLRKHLEPGVLTTRPSGYCLEVGPDGLDATRFERQVAVVAKDDGQSPTWVADRLREGLGLWRGPALADFAGALWAEPARARLEGLRLLAVEDLNEARLVLGEHARLVSELETLVRAHPLRERLWSQLMLGLYRSDRQADALRAYGRLRAHLGDELGIEPSSELARLEQAILLHEPELDWRPHRSASDGTLVEVPRGLPTGVVTFLLSDIVESTRLWDRHSAVMPEVLDRHDMFIAEVVARHGGRLLKQRGEGDSTFSVFTRATDALAAAAAIHQVLAEYAWPDGIDLLVRIGLHSGEALERDGDYHGTTVNRAARLRGLTGPGQILISQSTAELVADHLPDHLQLTELGPKTLRGLRRPEHIYAVSSSGSLELSPEPEPETDDLLPLPPELGLEAGVFVGRAEPVAHLVGAWQSARDGNRRVVLLAGEPGIGKTRLASEFARTVDQDGGLVLYGRCDDELGVAFQPFTEALRYLTTATPGALRDQSNACLSRLTRLIPELAELRPDLPPPPSGDPKTERYELFEAVCAFLASAAHATPVLLVLDDLHWAAKPTLLLLRHVVRATTPMSLLVVGTYRHTEVASSPVAETLQDLRACSGVETVHLAGFSLDEVRSYLTATRGDDNDQLARTLWADTNGNPLFVRETVRNLDDPGADPSLPQGVRDVIERRLNRLSLDTRDVLADAAVLGATFPVDFLERTARNPDHVLDTIDEAILAGILTEQEDAAETVQFTHALIRDTIYRSLSSTRRARLHHRAFEVLEAFGAVGFDDDRLPGLAYHSACAVQLGLSDAATQYALAAGRQALARLAPEDAIAQIERGLQLLELAPQPNRTRRAELLIALGEARLEAGDPKGMKDAARRASVEARSVNSPELLAAAAVLFGDWVLVGGTEAETLELLEEAVKLVGQQPSDTRARLLAVSAHHHALAGDTQRARELAPQALTMAREVGDDDTRWLALFARIVSLWGDEDVTNRLALAEEQLLVSNHVGHSTMAFSSLEHITSARAELGDVAGATDRLGELRQLASDWPGSAAGSLDPRRATNLRLGARMYYVWSWESPLHVLTAETFQHLIHGRWPEAERTLQQLLEGAHGDPNYLSYYGAQLFQLRREQGRSGEVIAPLRRMRQSGGVLPAFIAGLGLLSADVGDDKVAREESATLLEDSCASVPRDFAWTATLAMLSETCASTRSEGYAPDLYRLLHPHSGHLVVVHNLVLCLGAVDRYLGMLELLLGEWEQAEQHFESAVALETRIGSPPLLARTKYWYASMLLERSRDLDRDRAHVLLNDVVETAGGLGMVLLGSQANAMLHPVS